MLELDDLTVPIVQAPMAGGPSTPELAAAVARAGGLGFLAAGYRPVDTFAEDLAAVRVRIDGPFGVNLFAATPTEAPAADLHAYARRVAAATAAVGAAPGVPRSDDDALGEKLDVLAGDPVAVVSFTFGCPSAEVVDRLHDGGSAVWVTVTDVEEAQQALAVGADALVAQGVEAGGHRGRFDDAAPGGDLGVLALVQLLRAECDRPVVASGGIATGRAVAAVLCAGAAAAQVGTALMCAPEAGTSQPHRRALAQPGRTALTRAFSGRTARGIVNRFMVELGDDVPAAYPAVHHLTAPIRAKARAAGDADAVNLWAGQAHELVVEAPAEEMVRRLWADARAALTETLARHGG